MRGIVGWGDAGEGPPKAGSPAGKGRFGG